ncbi:hypothetical protein EV121DRAFT_288833 [Schizophyllum commune]
MSAHDTPTEGVPHKQAQEAPHAETELDERERRYLLQTADIPDHPSDPMDRFWHFGYALTPRECEEFYERHCTIRLTNGGDPKFRPAAIVAHLRFHTSWPRVNHVLVVPADDMQPLEEWMSPFAKILQVPAVTFFMVVSNAKEELWDEERRPRQGHMDQLTALFRKEPRWMRDALPKEMFHTYGHQL